MILDGELVPLDDFWPEELDHINSTMEQIRAQGNPDDEQEEAQKIGIRLPYSIGQKYTFGHKFTSREEQGEFISLSCRTDDAVVFQIICEQDKYWVTPFGTNRIYINDSVILETKKELAFGDVLSLEETKRYEPKVTLELLYLFQEWRLPSNNDNLDQGPCSVRKDDSVPETTKDASSNFLVTQNELIVSRILSFLPLKDIKAARLLSQLWNEEAIPIIRHRAWAHFHINCKEVMSPSKFFLFSHDLNNNSDLVQNWDIHLPTINYAHVFSWTKRDALRTKFTSDISWFLGQGRNISSLSLSGDIVVNSQDFDNCIAILESVAGTLQKLELSGKWMVYNGSGDNPNNSYHLPGTLAFPKLKSFTWSVSISIQDFYPGFYFGPSNPLAEELKDYNVSNFDWIYELIRTVAHVRDLHLNRGNLASFFLQKLDSFPNLQALGLKTCLADIKLSLRLPQRLKSLEWDCWDYLLGDDIPFLEQLLRKQGNSLETLSFSLPFGYWCDKNETINIPAMPKLKRLTVDYRGYCDENPTLSFGDGIIDYATHLPSLQSLTLIGDKAAMIFCQVLFPQEEQQLSGEQQVCETLDFKTSNYDNTELALLKVDGIPEMFPNVWNSWMGCSETNCLDYLHLMLICTYLYVSILYTI